MITWVYVHYYIKETVFVNCKYKQNISGRRIV